MHRENKEMEEAVREYGEGTLCEVGLIPSFGQADGDSILLGDSGR